jgi:hypothetical protein
MRVHHLRDLVAGQAAPSANGRKTRGNEGQQTRTKQPRRIDVTPDVCRTGTAHLVQVP